jgi:hypothetical protein
MANKAESIDWDFFGEPKIICTSRNKERWLRAEINVSDLIDIGGRLGIVCCISRHWASGSHPFLIAHVRFRF